MHFALESFLHVLMNRYTNVNFFKNLRISRLFFHIYVIMVEDIRCLSKKKGVIYE